jgi:AGZA family xanthine/uracil permease-like MFS transporter
MLNRVFHLRAHNTTPRREILAGFTTFVTMAYIIVVNPAILSFAGFPAGPTTVATILVAVVGCLLMAFYANRPIAVAPYMGENAFVAFGLAGMMVTDAASGRPHRRQFIGMYETGIVTSSITGTPALRLSLGTLVGVGAAGDMLDKNGNFPDVQKPMAVDALACVFASLVGTSTSGAFIESPTGIREGGRTGLTALTVAALFAVSIFFIPLATALQSLTYAYGPALIMVGILMTSSIKHLDTKDLTELVPAVVTIVMMLFTYNIADGLTAGLVLHPLMKTACGRPREVRPAAWLLAALCLFYYVFGVLH